MKNGSWRIWKWKPRDIKVVLLFMLTAIFFIATACGQGTGSGSGEVGSGSQGASDTGSSSEWQLGQGELSDTIGTPQDVVDSKMILPPYNYNEDLWKKTGYGDLTGEWLLHNGKGVFGYGLPSGTMPAGSEIYVELFSHDENGTQLDREIRVQLTELEGNYEKKDIVIDELVLVEKVSGNQRIFTGVLPEKENVAYVLSVEILGGDGEVEDTLVSLVHVPAKEMNASLSIAEGESISGSELTLVLENYGPTTLFFGVYYTIEKKINEEWRIVPLDLAFIDIGIILVPGDEYEETIDISELDAGEYRITKDIQVDGLDMRAVLAKEFVVE